MLLADSHNGNVSIWLWITVLKIKNNLLICFCEVLKICIYSDILEKISGILVSLEYFLNNRIIKIINYRSIYWQTNSQNTLVIALEAFFNHSMLFTKSYLKKTYVLFLWCSFVSTDIVPLPSPSSVIFSFPNLSLCYHNFIAH